MTSPKAGIVLGPWYKTEFYGNVGYGLHSNDIRGTTITVDPIDKVTPQDRVPLLVRSKGAEIGIRTRLRPLERAAFFKAYGDKSLKNIIYGGSGAFGNAATRLEAFYVKGGISVYGSYPDIDEMFQQQAVELDHKKRTAILHKMQQLAYERAIYAPIWLLGFLNGVGPRVGESGFQLIPGFAYTAPYEDITIKGS